MGVVDRVSGLASRFSMTERLAAALVGAVALIVAAPKFSDFRLILVRDYLPNAPVEYLPLVRAMWWAERAVVDTGFAMAVVTALVGVAGAIATYVILRRGDARPEIFVGPALLLAGQNVDTWVAASVAWAATRRSGAAAALAGALKVIPGLAAAPLVARSPRRLIAVAAGALLFLALPGVLAWGSVGEALELASVRTDADTTIWGLVLGENPDLTWQPLVLIAIAVSAIAWLVRVATLSEPGGMALAILAGLALNKLWQPHYVLWVTPALAVTAVNRWAVRGLEVASLLVFVVAWSDLAGSGWFDGAVAVRLVALVVVAASVWRADRCDADPRPR